jgi:hypothetical protein
MGHRETTETEKREELGTSSGQSLVQMLGGLSCFGGRRG